MSMVELALNELKKRLEKAKSIHDVIRAVDEGVTEACRAAGGGKMGPEYAIGHLLQVVARGEKVESRCVEHGETRVCVYIAGNAVIVAVIDNDLLIYAEGCLLE